MFTHCFGIVQVRKNEISLPKWSGGTQYHHHGGALVGLALANKPPSPPIWSGKYYKSVEFVKLWNVKHPCTDVKPIEDFLATILVVLRIFVT